MAFDALGNYSGPDEEPPKIAAPAGKKKPAVAQPGKPVSIQIQQSKDALVGTGKLVFPNDLEQMGKYFKLTFGTYSRDAIDSASQVIGTDTVFLPLPANLNDYVKTEWQDVALGTFLGGASDSMASFVTETAKEFTMSNAITNAGAAIKDIAGKVKGDSGLSYALLRRGISALSDDAAVIADQAMGATGNPHMSLAFRGVPLRSHTFTWKLAPENRKESEDLARIVALLKGRSLPQKVGDFLLSYPDICEPQLCTYKNINQLMLMKRSVITDVRVNYAGGGVPSFFSETGAPVVIDLSITLKELSIVTRSDYAKQYSGMTSLNSGVQ